jgi:hypothetical protein
LSGRPSRALFRGKLAQRKLAVPSWLPGKFAAIVPSEETRTRYTRLNFKL